MSFQSSGTLVDVCGRYVSTTRSSDVAALYGAGPVGDLPAAPSWNVAPTQGVSVVVQRPPRDEDEPARQLRGMRWGLVPSWTKGPGTGPLMINARVETASTLPAFRTAWRRRRAVIPAVDGYYEWTAVDEGGRRPVKQPWYIHPEDGDHLTFAALYELWPDRTRPEDDPSRWLWSVTILTTDARGPAGEIHDRTPVILPAARIDDWLDPGITDPDRVQRIVAGVEPPPLEVRQVSREVNRSGPDGPQLIEPVTSASDTPLLLITTS